MIDQEPRELVVVDQLPLALDLSSRFHLAWKGYRLSSAVLGTA
jgi:hypothetical protein